MPKMRLFPEKEDERNFCFYSGIMLTFDKMQKTIPLMSTNFGIGGQSIFKAIQAFHTIRIVLYIGCSGPVVECLNKINMLQSTTGPLGQNS